MNERMFVLTPTTQSLEHYFCKFTLQSQTVNQSIQFNFLVREFILTRHMKTKNETNEASNEDEKKTNSAQNSLT